MKNNKLKAIINRARSFLAVKDDNELRCMVGNVDEDTMKVLRGFSNWVGGTDKKEKSKSSKSPATNRPVPPQKGNEL